MKFAVVFWLNAFSVAMADVFPVLDISHAAEKYYTLVKCYSQSQTKKIFLKSRLHSQTRRKSVREPVVRMP